MDGPATPKSCVCTMWAGANSRGQLVVDEHFRTAKPHIYAVGDVIGYRRLASAAYTQGRSAAIHLLGQEDNTLRHHDIPTGIYTSPGDQFGGQDRT